MKKLAMLAVTWDQDDPENVKRWSVARMKTLDGVWHGPWEGFAAADFMQQFAVVVLWHFPPPAMVMALRAEEVEVIAAVEITDVKTKPEWCDTNEKLRSVLAGAGPTRRISGQTNRFGHHMIDAYEESPGTWDEKPHVWAINVDTPAVLGAVTKYIGGIWGSRWLAERPSGFFIDTHIPTAYFGTATNAPHDRPSIDWRDIDHSLSGRFAPVWGHSASGTPSCWNTIEEWALRDMSLSGVAGLIRAMRLNDRTITLCPNGGQSDYDKFIDLKGYGIMPDYFQVARSGLFATPECDLLGV